MKTSTQTIYSAKFAMTTSAIAAIACISIAAATSFTKIEVTSPLMVKNDVMSVVIEGKRMSPEQKLAYDLESQEEGSTIATVIIRAKRLSDKEKIQMDKQDLVMQASINSKISRTQIDG
jgi:hypothetical protein